MARLSLAALAAAVLAFVGTAESALILNGFTAGSDCGTSATQLYSLITPKNCDVNAAAVCTANATKSVCVETQRPQTMTVGSAGTYLVFSEFQGDKCDGGQGGTYYQGAGAILDGACVPLIQASSAFGVPGYGKASCAAGGNATLSFFWDSACTLPLGTVESKVPVTSGCNFVSPAGTKFSFSGSCQAVTAGATVNVPAAPKTSGARRVAGSAIAAAGAVVGAALLL